MQEKKEQLSWFKILQYFNINNIKSVYKTRYILQEDLLVSQK